MTRETYILICLGVEVLAYAAVVPAVIWTKPALAVTYACYAIAGAALLWETLK